jgi:hypothetical protein
MSRNFWNVWWETLANWWIGRCTIRHHGRVARDTSWGTASHNALDNIKSLDELIKATEALGSHRDHGLTSMRTVIWGVLRKVHWSENDAMLYAMAGLLPRWIVNTMEWYFHQLIHLLTMSHNNEYYKHVGQVHLKFPAGQLMQIRQYAITCTDMIL